MWNNREEKTLGRAFGGPREHGIRRGSRAARLQMERQRLMNRFNTIDESKRMCPHLYVQHVATYRNGESEAGYWGEVDPTSHKVSRLLYPVASS